MRRAGVFVVLLLLGCGGSLRQAAGPVTTGAVQALDDPPNREALGTLLGSPEVGEGARVLASEVGTGLAQGLSEEEVAQALSIIASRAAEGAAVQLRESLRTDLQPFVRELAQEITVRQRRP